MQSTIRLRETSPVLRQILDGPQADRIGENSVEFDGVRAGAFTPRYWERNTLHWLPDIRTPFLAPRQEGRFRNIYAPSVVEESKGWRVFYGAWDGVATGNDRIYSVTTDFLKVRDRQTVIEHGGFIHVCNVNVQKLRRPVRGARFHMVATAYPDAKGRNKPIYFSSTDGKLWNHSSVPYVATPDDLITVTGYPNYSGADLNGGNVLLRADNRWLLYFFDFKDPFKTFLAEAGDTSDPRRLTYRGIALPSSGVPNDVKILRADGRDWYLMGLHRNGDSLFYSLSGDPAQFPPQQTLFRHQSTEDRYMVAIGWVCQANRVLGALYGAGPVSSLDRNSLFARWLQKRIALTGTLTLYAEDGITRLGSRSVTLRPGKAYRL